MTQPFPDQDPEKIARLREHYQVEKELAQQLKQASPEARRHLYNQLYDELYRRLPNHPRWMAKNDPEQRRRAASKQIALIERFLPAGTVFLEIGPGDCCLSGLAARRVKQVYAVDVSASAMSQAEKLPNLACLVSDGVSIPVPPGSVDTAYSNQLMEHLHPDDARAQLQAIFAALAPGGRYICCTPNRLDGPHDVSKYFDETATGFHLKEYTHHELRDLMLAAGFKRVRAYLTLRGRLYRKPLGAIVWLEGRLLKMSSSARRRWMDLPGMHKLFNLFVVAEK